MRTILILIFCSIAGSVFAQKTLIDSTAYSKWPSLGNELGITNDGKYVSYTIENRPLRSHIRVLQSIDSKWKKEFAGREASGLISPDDKYFFHKGKDSLGVLTLGTSLAKYTPGISSFFLKDYKDSQLLCYVFSNMPQSLVLKDMKTGHKNTYAGVKSYRFSEEGSVLLLWKDVPGKPGSQSLYWVDRNRDQLFRVWEGEKAENLVLDERHRQLAFRQGEDVWYYKVGFAGAICETAKSSSAPPNSLTLVNIDHFSKDGASLFVTLKENHKTQPAAGVVEVWSYRDVFLQTEQDEQAKREDNYLASIDLRTQKFIRLQQRYDSEITFPSKGPDTLALVMNKQPVEEWSRFENWTLNLISVQTGKRKKVDVQNINPTASLSSMGRYLLYYSFKDKGYFSYEISTGIVRDLTRGLIVSWQSLDRDDFSRIPFPRGTAAWLENDESVLVYDTYDIWKLDPLNKRAPVNLTNGFGRKHHIVFNIMAEDGKAAINNDSKLFLTAFNKENKNNEFFLKQLNKTGDPELLSMGPYVFKIGGAYVEDGYFTPLKAKNAEAYLVRRMSATDAPNYFSTGDFKTFTRLSNLQPQKKYNWYTTELHTWKSLDGRKLQGILYKPENFDPNKKYPVIFNYYERESDGLNAYIKPEPLCNGCQIDIPTYVSNGYLVFTPDIYYRIGDPMQGTYDAVVSAAKYIAGLPFVDGKKMGIQGCSFGGFQTNYLVTHTNLFAAAASASGIADLISGYGNVTHGGNSNESLSEIGQLRIGASLWERPEAYIRNSPIFGVAQVTTPFLMMHTKKDDGNCAFTDALQLFTGLRRMGKKAWMLVYSEGAHGIYGKEATDFSTRMMQFFDHYLKDKPAPVWMLDGVSAQDRGWKAGLELDRKGITPGQGLLTQQEQLKVDSMMNRKPITISLR